MAAFVLVSGAFHAGWCWERVVPLLEAAGHRALAPDLLGMGDDPTPLVQVTLADWAEQIAALARAEEEPVILAGHSRGGIVISAAAELAPDRIRRLVYIAAVLAAPGGTVYDTLAGADGLPGDELPQIVLDDGSMVPPREASTRVFYSGTPAAWADRAAVLLSPEPSRVLTTPLQLTPARYGTVPRAYIECSADRAIPLNAQRAMQRAQACDPVATMASDHSPFYSDPEGLAAILIRMAKA